ncbi:type IX secretion system protein PorQ [Hydrotalea sp.]|uniref:type IX secretion system protein PorQ n=1 Tax=Hydrotalea sp. TaxID=2881279 RepID=UPI00260D5BCD|nr:type IX secretion system protein PorQ [Hydrotalea sp.]
MKQLQFLIFLLFCSKAMLAQTLGGNTVYNFVTQPNTAQLSALGGVNISNISNDVGMVFQNPALLRPSMQQQLNTSFNNFVAGIKNYSLTTSWYLNKPQTNIAIGINYFDYGILAQTDAAGNVFGTFKPVDYVAQLMFSHAYHTHWWIGGTFKFINSHYAQYKSSGLAVDIGFNYYDSIKGFQAAFVVKNMGSQLKTYTNGVKEELPFDVQLGITKKLAKAPLQFSLTAHHLQTFNTLYNDTAFNAAYGTITNNSSFINQLVTHLVASVQLMIDHKVEVTAGYNFLRRHDLNVYATANGLNGFTLGAGVLFKKIHIRYATGFYQQNLFHQVSLNFNWKGDAF